MLKSKVGYSVLEDAKAAGMEAATNANSCCSNPTMAYVYCSCAYDVSEVMSGVKEVLPSTVCIGNTSFTGVVTPAGYVGGDTPFVGVMSVGSEDMVVGASISEPGECAYEAGVKIAKEAMEKAGKTCPPKYFYMVASPKEEETYLKGISSVIGRIPFFGGSAADNSIAGEWSLYLDETIVADGCAVAFVWDAPCMTNKFSAAYRETEDCGIITKVDGKRTLMEINGKPACDVYREWTGCDVEAVSGGNLLVTTITSPLGVKDRLGDLIAIRHPMNGNEDGSMNIGNNLSEKTCIIRMEASIDELIASVETTLHELLDKTCGTPNALHLVHCGGRRAGIDSRIDELADICKKVCGDIPFIMEFTFGEYGYESDNNNTCGGLMLSFTAL